MNNKKATILRRIAKKYKLNYRKLKKEININPSLMDTIKKYEGDKYGRW